jgi:hypothetical protein
MVRILADQDLGMLTHPAAAWVPRERGYGAVPAIQLPIEIDDEDCIFWASYRDVWRVVGRPAREFLSADLTFFRGSPTSIKTQVFRVEWCGPRKINGRTEFSPPFAAHPHWQFDYSVDREDAIARAVELLRAPRDEVEEFAEVAPVPAGPSRPVGLERWRRIHFAARAHWADLRFIASAEGATPHAHAPKNCAEIENWVISTLVYVMSELSKAYG